MQMRARVFTSLVYTVVLLNKARCRLTHPYLVPHVRSYLFLSFLGRSKLALTLTPVV